MSDRKIDNLIRASLEEAKPVESDTDFLARLHQRLEAEGALDPTAPRRGLLWRWRWAAGLATASLCGLFAITLWPSPDVMEATPPDFQTVRQEVAQLAAENSGSPMVIEINERRGSVLFVSLNETDEDTSAIDPDTITTEGNLNLRSSGWIRTRRVSDSTT